MNLLTDKQVAQKLACAVSYVWRLSTQDSTFPKPVRLGNPDGPRRGRVTRWVETDINEWLKNRLTNKQEVEDEAGRTGGNVHQDSGQEVAA